MVRRGGNATSINILRWMRPSADSATLLPSPDASTSTPTSTEFARLWRQGIVYRADRDTTPWSPTIFDVAQSPHGEFYAELTEFFYTMLEFYDHVIGPAEHT